MISKSQSIFKRIQGETLVDLILIINKRENCILFDKNTAKKSTLHCIVSIVTLQQSGILRQNIKF